MDAKSFFELVANLRDAQRGCITYFTHDWFVKAHQYERQVDAEIERVRKKKNELEKAK